MKVVLRLLALSLVFVVSVYGAEITWTGGGGGDGVWGNSANWSGGVPGSGDEVIFPAGEAVSVTLSGNTTVKLIRNWATLNITVPSGVVLELSNGGSEVFSAYADAVIGGGGAKL